jgi:sarcosine oxidase delta subunit
VSHNTITAGGKPAAALPKEQINENEFRKEGTGSGSEVEGREMMGESKDGWEGRGEGSEGRVKEGLGYRHKIKRKRQERAKQNESGNITGATSYTSESVELWRAKIMARGVENNAGVKRWRHVWGCRRIKKVYLVHGRENFLQKRLVLLFEGQSETIDN